MEIGPELELNHVKLTQILHEHGAVYIHPKPEREREYETGEDVLLAMQIRVSETRCTSPTSKKAKTE